MMKMFSIIDLAMVCLVGKIFSEDGNSVVNVAVKTQLKEID